MITGYGNSQGKLFGTYMKMLEFGKLEFLSQIDVSGKTNRCNFGVELTIGQ